MWICVGPRDPDTKPSRGCLRVVELSAIPQLPKKIVTGEEAITKKTFRVGGGCFLGGVFFRALQLFISRAALLTDPELKHWPFL